MLKERMKDIASPWTTGKGDHCDVVLSSRIRLARNFKEYPFPLKQNGESARHVWRIFSDMVATDDDLQFYELARLDDITRQVLVEKHLISPAHARNDEHYRAVVLSDDGNISLMINEEDHLRLQVFGEGLSLSEIWPKATALDDAIESRAAYAFDEKLGYLTSCPTNLGTGLRASILVHLPGLRMTKQLSVLQSLNEIGMTVRGLFGEGSESAGDLYQISNQQTLGQSEEDIIHNLNMVAKRLIEKEHEARQQIKHTLGLSFEDRVWRTYGQLLYARQLNSKEAYDFLSWLRFGIGMEMIPDLTLQDVDSLYIAAQSGYLMLLDDKNLSAAERDEKRAELFRYRLNNRNGVI